MEFTFKLLSGSDLPLLSQWLAKPHVCKWWRESSEPGEVSARYKPYIEKTEPTEFFIASTDTKPIGSIQAYLNEDYPEHDKTINIPKSIGIDLFIGEEDYIGKGYGPAMLTQFVENILKKSDKYKDSDVVVADPEVINHASIRAFEKAGFKKGAITAGEYGPEQLMLLMI